MNNAPPLRELADLYLLRCEVEGKSPRTVIAYRGTLARFLGAVDIEHAADVTQEHVYAYVGGCRSLAAESRHRYFREVRCFFNWLVDSERLEKSPFRGMKNVRLPQRIVQPARPGRDRPPARSLRPGRDWPARPRTAHAAPRYGGTLLRDRPARPLRG